MDRREFLRNAALVGMAAGLDGCAGALKFGGGSGSMSNFAVAPMRRIRVGFVGVGERGLAAVRRVPLLPGVEATALCDLDPERVAAGQKRLADSRKPAARFEYGGRPDSWKGLCDNDEVDVVYVCTPAGLHAEMTLYALRAGKHVLVEVPAVQTNDEAWEIVETCEKARRHCMMLENCIYGEMELLAWNLAHRGLLGTLTHAEGGYIHNLAWRHLEDHPRNRDKMVPGYVEHDYGNTYPTHALGPICTYMDMNRGDRMETVLSVSSLAATQQELAAFRYGPDAWQNRARWRTGDMNTSVIRTAKGRTIMMQIDMCTPRPYSRINLIQGSRGCFCDFPPRVLLGSRPGGDIEGWADEKNMRWREGAEFEEIARKYRHPLWVSAGEVAKPLGGHGGLDFMMDLRWVYCLENGLPLDMDVYDLASWSSVVPCSAESDRRGGAPVDLPDFTRGAWRTAKPVSIGAVDLAKWGFDNEAAQYGRVKAVY